jgi:hypothetical protein
VSEFVGIRGNRGQTTIFLMVSKSVVCPLMLMFKEGGAGASVRPISPKDNMGLVHA